MTKEMTIAEIADLQISRMAFDKLEKECWKRGVRLGTALADLTPYLLEVHNRLSKPGYRSDLTPKGLTWTKWCEANRDNLGMAPSTIRALLASLKQPALDSAEVPPAEVVVDSPPAPAPKRKKLSAEECQRIGEEQQARWEKYKAESEAAEAAPNDVLDGPVDHPAIEGDGHDVTTPSAPAAIEPDEITCDICDEVVAVVNGRIARHNDPAMQGMPCTQRCPRSEQAYQEEAPAAIDGEVLSEPDSPAPEPIELSAEAKQEIATYSEGFLDGCKAGAKHPDVPIALVEGLKVEIEGKVYRITDDTESDDMEKFLVNRKWDGKTYRLYLLVEAEE